MKIANPIYDVVMKYLLEDNKLARLLLGAIIGAKIEKLEAGIAELHLLMANPDFYQKSQKDIKLFQDKLKKLEADLASAYQRWEKLE